MSAGRQSFDLLPQHVAECKVEDCHGVHAANLGTASKTHYSIPYYVLVYSIIQYQGRWDIGALMQ